MTFSEHLSSNPGYILAEMYFKKTFYEHKNLVPCLIKTEDF